MQISMNKYLQNKCAYNITLSYQGVPDRWSKSVEQLNHNQSALLTD